jgi:hypothetical protein
LPQLRHMPDTTIFYSENTPETYQTSTASAHVTRTEAHQVHCSVMNLYLIGVKPMPLVPYIYKRILVFHKLNSAIESGTKPDALGWKPCHWTSTWKAAMVHTRCA